MSFHQLLLSACSEALFQKRKNVKHALKKMQACVEQKLSLSQELDK